MQKLSISILCSIISLGASAQYYYKDIISNRQLKEDMNAYKEKKIRSIKINSFDFDGMASEGFFCEKKMSKDFRKAELFTRSSGSATSLFTSIFDDKGNLLSSTDSSEISVSHNNYFYDDAGRVKRIVSTVKSSDDDFSNEISEEHIYDYNDQGIATGMTVIKNKTNPTRILFSTDDRNNISIEKETKSGSKYYYYYDTKDRLTDVVHANEYRPNLVAIYLFEYDEPGHITQMTTTEEGSNNYFVWRYMYNDNLRTKERLYSKDRKLMGSIEYEYN
jgi:hypothetical protein